MGALRKKSKSLSESWLRFARHTINQAGIIDERCHSTLVEAFSAVSRDKFVLPSLASQSMLDCALPALYDQICDKPSWIARVLGLLGIQPGMRVLELGCGCGYSSALMAQAGVHVFALEDSALVAQRTRKLLDSLYLHNVILRHANSVLGWAEQGPFDAIVSWRILSKVDDLLIKQLVSPSGRLVTRIAEVVPSESQLTKKRSPAAKLGIEDANTASFVSVNDGLSAQSILTLWETREQGSVYYQLEHC